MKYLSITLMIWTLATAAMAADTCDLAYDVAGKAAETFANDQAAGLQLFIKARQLCETDPAFSYNLGVAYYQYGRLDEAQRYLEQATKANDRNPRWLNNLAMVRLDQRQTAEAVTTAEKAVTLNGNEPTFHDTLIRAHLAAAQFDKALTTARVAHEKWLQNTELEQTYRDALDTYLAHNLELIQQGQVDTGLAGLKQADFSAAAVAIFCQALVKVGRTEQALNEATSARQRFRDDKEVEALFSDILQQTLRGFYVDFQAGNAATAVQAAKALHERYPSEKTAKATYDELFNAFLADAKTIEIPKAAAAVHSPATTTGRTDALLARLGSSDNTPVDLSLTVDVDEQIPRSAQKSPYAVAVVIGNQSYQKQGNGIGDVRYAGRDAAVMKRYLQTTLGFEEKNIITALDASAGELRNIFGTRENPRGRLQNFVRPGESDVFIYYVGHGAPGPDGKSAYLVPVDAQADYIANNGYPLDLFYNVVEQLPAKSVTVVLDACFSGDSPAGALFDNISPIMVKNINPLREVKNTLVFSSADKDQVSTWYPAKRHSMFTYWFLKGLGGAADADSDKQITAGELQSYLNKEVPYWAQREANRVQTPQVTGDRATVLARIR